MGTKTATIEVKDNSGKTATNSCSVVVEESTDYAYYIDPKYVELGIGESQQFDGWFDDGSGFEK